MKKHPKLRLVGGLGVGGPRAAVSSLDSEPTTIPDSAPETQGQSPGGNSQRAKEPKPASDVSHQKAHSANSQNTKAESKDLNSSKKGDVSDSHSADSFGASQALKKSANYQERKSDEAFDVVSPSGLKDAEKSVVENLLGRISEQSVLVGVAKTEQAWDIRPIVKRPENSKPSLIRFIDPIVCEKDIFSYRIKDIFGRVKSYSDLSEAIENWGLAGNQVWYRRRLVDNTLGDLLRVSKPLDAERARAIAIGLCQELERWHNRGLAHGHICASNIALEKDSKVTLLDIGVGASVVQALKPGSSNNRLDLSRNYQIESFAPEIYSSESVLFTADIYGLGRVLKQIIAKVDIKTETESWIRPLGELAERMVRSKASERPRLPRILELLDVSKPETKIDVRSRVRQILDQYGPGDTIVPSDENNPAIAKSDLDGLGESSELQSPESQASQQEVLSELADFDSNSTKPAPSIVDESSRTVQPVLRSKKSFSPEDQSAFRLDRKGSNSPLPDESTSSVNGRSSGPTFNDRFQTSEPEPTGRGESDKRGDGDFSLKETITHQASEPASHKDVSPDSDHFGYVDDVPLVELAEDDLEDPYDPFDEFLDSSETGSAQARYSELKHQAHSGADRLLYLGAGLVLLLVGLFFFRSSDTPIEEPVVISKESAAELWKSGILANKAQVVRSAISGEKPSVVAENLLVKTALRNPNSEPRLNSSLIRVAYDKRWMEELAQKDRRAILSIAASGLINGELPKDLAPIDSLHPGAILGLAVTAGNNMSKPLAELPLDKFSTLIPPIGPAFSRLSADPSVSKLGEKPALTLAKLATLGLEPGLEATDELYSFLGVNTTLRLQVLALLFIDNEAGAEQVLNTVLDHPNRRLDHPLTTWGDEQGLVDSWSDLAATQRLMILSGLKPGGYLENTKVAQLFVHPSPSLRAYGINQSLEQISYNHPGAFEVLRQLSAEPEMLGPEETIKLGEMLLGPQGIKKPAVEKWLESSPPPPLVFSMLATNTTNQAKWSMDFLLAKYLRSLNYVPSLDELEKLIHHSDSLTRLYSYSSIKQSSGREKAIELFNQALAKEKNPDYINLLKTYLEIN